MCLFRWELFGTTHFGASGVFATQHGIVGYGYCKSWKMRASRDWLFCRHLSGSSSRRWRRKSRCSEVAPVLALRCGTDDRSQPSCAAPERNPIRLRVATEACSTGRSIELGRECPWPRAPKIRQPINKRARR